MFSRKVRAELMHIWRAKRIFHQARLWLWESWGKKWERIW